MKRKHWKNEKQSKEKTSTSNKNKGDLPIIFKTNSDSIIYSPSDANDCGRARTPRNTGTLKNIGKFPSLKNKATIWFESLLERDFIYLIEFDNGVLKYREQPFKIRYSADGKSRLYTPDFFVQKENVKQVIEIKPQSKIENEEFKVFSSYITNFLAAKGVDYLVITDSTIRLQPRLSNIKLLWRYARVPITARHRILINEFTNNSSGRTLSEICSFFHRSKEQKELVYALLFHGYLITDIEKPITAETLVFRGNLN